MGSPEKTIVYIVAIAAVWNLIHRYRTKIKKSKLDAELNQNSIKNDSKIIDLTSASKDSENSNDFDLKNKRNINKDSLSVKSDEYSILLKKYPFKFYIGIFVIITLYIGVVFFFFYNYNFVEAIIGGGFLGLVILVIVWFIAVFFIQIKFYIKLTMNDHTIFLFDSKDNILLEINYHDIEKFIFKPEFEDGAYGIKHFKSNNIHIKLKPTFNQDSIFLKKSATSEEFKFDLEKVLILDEEIEGYKNIKLKNAVFQFSKINNIYCDNQY